MEIDNLFLFCIIFIGGIFIASFFNFWFLPFLFLIIGFSFIGVLFQRGYLIGFSLLFGVIFFIF
jgi:hypothetical protein